MDCVAGQSLTYLYGPRYRTNGSQPNIRLATPGPDELGFGSSLTIGFVSYGTFSGGVDEKLPSNSSPDGVTVRWRKMTRRHHEGFSGTAAALVSAGAATGSWSKALP